MRQGVRRVVTGCDGSGRSVIASDGPAPARGPLLFDLWSAPSVVQLPSDGRSSPVSEPFPAPGGFRFVVFGFPPGRDVPLHRSDTVDFGVVLSGEVWLEVEGGAETLLRAGDTVVQCGARHAWHNRSAEPCVMAFAIVGAEPAPG
jgi:quercetin dioxygenase-like cupin family protein